MCVSSVSPLYLVAFRGFAFCWLITPSTFSFDIWTLLPWVLSAVEMCRLSFFWPIVYSWFGIADPERMPCVGRCIVLIAICLAAGDIVPGLIWLETPDSIGVFTAI
jgi:hypothetical protein